jgi:hypothetical protein
MEATREWIVAQDVALVIAEEEAQAKAAAAGNNGKQK